MTNTNTIPPTVPVDWDWANAQRTLPIFSAVALSLGHDIEVLAPLHQKWRDRPFVEPPKDYALRIAATHQAVRDGTLKSHSTSQAGAPFDVNADFADAQCWEISLLEFRHFCDAMGWRTPTEFRPTGYAPTEEPPQGVPAESSASSAPDTSKGTPSKLTEADKAEILRLYDRGRGTPVNALAKRFGVSRPIIDKVLRRAGIKN